MNTEAADEPADPVRDAIREGYYRLLLSQGKTAAQQFVIDWLLAEPEPFLEWLDHSPLAQGGPMAGPGLDHGWLF